jgi:hypothetical protein
MAGTYGLGAAGLTGFGMGQKDQALGMLGKAADVEQSRNLQNEQLEAQHEAGKAQFGSTLGAMGGMALGASYGSAGGPIGAVIGGIVGALASDLF